MSKFRKRVFEFTPQLDVEIPVVRLEEATCNVANYGAVYDLTLRDYNDKTIVTTLTIEELIVFRAYIDSLIELRNTDPARESFKTFNCV